MLKIKDNVDLKELEKYGYFKYCNNEYVKDFSYADERVTIWVQKDKSFFVEWGWYVMYGEEQERFVQDLIKADLVEKVNLCLSEY